MTTGTELTTTNNIPDHLNVAHTNKLAPFIPDGFASVIRFSELVAASGMAPKDMKTDAQIAVAIFHGMELGLTPMSALQSIAVINGRPSIWGDGALAVVRASGELEEFEERYEGGSVYLSPPQFDDFGKLTKAGTPNPEYKAVCHIKRKGKPAKDYEFSVLDAIEAGLYNKDGPWKQYRKRMLQMRARGFALRDEFTDVMRGLHLAEEVQDYDIDAVPLGKEEPPEDPSAKNEPAAAGKRTRKPKEAVNKYQDGGEAKDKVEEAEVLSETKAGATSQSEPESRSEKGSDEDPPADPAKSTPKETPKATPKEDAPIGDDDDDDAFLAKLLAEVGPDKPLKDHLIYIDKLLRPITTEEVMRKAWSERERMKGMVASQKEFTTRLRDHYKAKLTAQTQAEEPPAEDDKPAGKVFDFDGFIDMLDKKLGEETTPDMVNKVYAQMTTGPIKDGLVTTQQIEEGFRALLAEHLERTDFGN